MFERELCENMLTLARIDVMATHWRAEKDELLANIILGLGSLDFQSPNDLEILRSVANKLPPGSATRNALVLRIDAIVARYKIWKS